MNVTTRQPATFARTDGLVTHAQGFAVISLICMSAFAALVLLLHAIKPEFDPSWRFLSEYSIGRHGWVMMMAFFLWATSCFSLAAAVREHLRTRRGRIGRLLLMIVGGSLIMAGLFAQDPITARPDELTTHGNLHAIASMIGIPSIPIAALLITSSVKRDARWQPYALLLNTTAHFAWLSLLAMAVYLATAVPRASGFGPDVQAGWMNRVVVLAYAAWQFSASYGAYRASDTVRL